MILCVVIIVLIVDIIIVMLLLLLLVLMIGLVLIMIRLLLLFVVFLFFIFSYDCRPIRDRVAPSLRRPLPPGGTTRRSIPLRHRTRRVATRRLCHTGWRCATGAVVPPRGVPSRPWAWQWGGIVAFDVGAGGASVAQVWQSIFRSMLMLAKW